MGTLRSCDQLREEHRLIGQVVGGLDALSARRRGGSGVPVLPVAGAIDFFTGFVSGCHDVKETRVLFPVLAASGVDDGGLMQALQDDHEEADRLLAALQTVSADQCLDGPAWTLLEAYLGLLRRHIASEDGGLLPFAEEILSPEDDARLERGFLEVEERALGRGGAAVLVGLASAVTEASTALSGEPAAPGTVLLARQIMRARPATLGPRSSLARAAELMDALQTREVPVVNGPVLVGIISRSDLEPHRGHYEWTPVRAAMTANPVTVEPDVPVAAVAQLLLGRGFNAVPVTERGELLGMISRKDVLRAFAGEEPAA